MLRLSRKPAPRVALLRDDDANSKDFPRIARDVGKRHLLDGHGGGGILGG